MTPSKLTFAQVWGGSLEERSINPSMFQLGIPRGWDVVQWVDTFQVRTWVSWVTPSKQFAAHRHSQVL